MLDLNFPLCKRLPYAKLVKFIDNIYELLIIWLTYVKHVYEKTMA